MFDGDFGGFGRGGATINTVKTTITSAQILNSFSVPVMLLPAPGAGKFYDVLKITFRLNWNSIAYATNTLGAIFNTVDGVSTGAFSVGQMNATSLLTKTFSAFMPIGLSIVATTVTSPIIAVNTPLWFTILNGNPTAGNSTLDVWVTYVIQDS